MWREYVLILNQEKRMSHDSQNSMLQKNNMAWERLLMLLRDARGSNEGEFIVEDWSYDLDVGTLAHSFVHSFIWRKPSHMIRQ